MTARRPAPASVLVLGGTSDIGLAIARRYARTGAALVLAARRPEALAADAADIRLRHGVPVDVVRFDATDPDPDRFLDALPALPDTVVCAVGLLGDQAEAERDPAAATAVMEATYLGPARVLSAVANRMEARGAGSIVALSSVAGDRGRRSNYVYGSAKAGLTAFLSGLAARLAPAGVHVLTVKPGFVRTRMTAGLRLPGALTAEADAVAAAVLAAEARGRAVVYVLPVWRPVMALIRALPEPIFRRLPI